jgi:5-amino-6-(5-phospho-D-ribitylamino)uracil phosphatase
LIDIVDLRVDELIVFGDNHNDISIFNVATKAVAVRNAPDEVKLHASQTIGTNQEDWVIDYIADYVKRIRC